MDNGTTPEEFLAELETVLIPLSPAVTWVADENEMIFGDGSRFISSWDSGHGEDDARRPGQPGKNRS